ncbi:hypothetical protein [Inhella proteolytica]|uniref:Uncharacterized protein n=1 Tax=Inhella proteolytica TaxID=2795029 RepID=A0A931NJP7_9BURK|nr:hypothetical protein [Inhella proteolytica]MBH9579229.1 hypothetical protein [Inhella proteolytica]
MSDNYKAFRVHRALAVLYGVLALLLSSALFFPPMGYGQWGVLPVLVFFGLVAFVHGWTAMACRAGSEPGRKASIAIAVLMLCGFPIGTLIGAYLLSVTWKGWPAPQFTAS